MKGSARQGAKLPMLRTRVAVVLSKEVGFSHSETSLTDPLLSARDVDVLVVGDKWGAFLL